MQHTRTQIVRRLAGAAVFAVVAAGCAGSSDGGSPEDTTPDTEVSTAPATAAPPTEAPVVTDPATDESTVDPADIPEVPCAEYVTESGFPLKPCDSGVLVEQLQRDLESLFPAIGIDGLYGAQTFGFIQEIQTANGLEATGLVSEELADQISEATSIDSVVPDAGGDTATESDPEDDTSDTAITAERCNELVGNADDPDFTADAIEACSELGVDLVGEG